MGSIKSKKQTRNFNNLSSFQWLVVCSDELLLNLIDYCRWLVYETNTQWERGRDKIETEPEK
ncbi:hypothetical protein T12_2093 [Trichinella patagoniensis]|uniref:Uncharacterized protein n=1 Tax=Trichinella patagoniensis TaxID=990121 RepID=A0A0V0ZUR5_9BILA|nr:hypothetical protein T12_2093 [Trichinella patagoniensis]